MAAIRQAKEARDAAEARRARILKLLTAEGLQEYQHHLPRVQAYISSGQGSEGAVLEAARQKRAEGQRRVAVAARLAAEGIPEHFMRTLPSMYAYISRSEGSEDAAVASAVARHQLEQAELQRRTAMRALLAAEELPESYATSYYGVPAVLDYIQCGEGSEEGAMEAARAHHQEQLPRLQRNARVVELLTANLLSLSYRYYLPAIAKFISTGEGTEEGVLAAARAQQLQEMAYPASDGDYSDEFL